MKPAELNYAVHEKELLAIISALKHWRHYLIGQEIDIYSDHNSLKYLETQPTLSRRQARWVETLQEYHIKIHYHPGKLNVVADALSRINTLSIETDWTLKIKEKYQDDIFFSQVIKKPQKQFEIREGLIFTTDGNRLCIPDIKELKKNILHDHHDSLTAGHFGFDKTYEAIHKLYYWPKMSRDIRKYIMSCDTCQRAKTQPHKPAGLLQPLPIPNYPWEEVSMDFITTLPKTKTGHDAILVVVDRLTKMAHFIPTTTNADAPSTANLFFNHVFRIHGLPKKIISDRDPKFTSHFWKKISSLLDLKLGISTAFHPQTDGQTERTNRTLEQMLRMSINYKQDNWDTLLPYAEFAYNNAKQSSTNTTPFKLNYGRDVTVPNSLNEFIKDDHVPTASNWINEISQSIKNVKDELLKAQHRQEKYANLLRREESYKLNDMVLLKTHNLKIEKDKTRKFTNKFVGPFKIIEIISTTAYRLELPKTWKIHNVFHIAQLRRYHSESEFHEPAPPPPEPIEVEGELELEVEEILDKRVRKYKNKTKVQYKVLWKGYPIHDATWEPMENLKNASEAIEEYELKIKEGRVVTEPAQAIHRN